VKIDVSIGEVVDKVTILEIKKEKFKNAEKLANVVKEYELLKKEIEAIGITTDSDEFKRLKEVNLKLWQIEDDIRLEESKHNFGEKFIKLARSVYFENDKRAAIKKEINLKYGSDLIEEKGYFNYQARK
jgi:alpha/beta superfamily hydrolase